MDDAFRMNRIMTLARPLKAALLILAILHPIIVLVVIASMSDAQLAFAAIGQVPQTQAPSSVIRTVVIGLAIVPAIVLSIGLFAIRSVLTEMQAGRPFGAATFRGLRRLAVAVVISTLIKIINVPIVAMLLTWQNDETQFALSFGLGDLQMLVLGGTIWLMAWVMAEGHRLASENAQFV